MRASFHNNRQTKQTWENRYGDGEDVGCCLVQYFVSDTFLLPLLEVCGHKPAWPAVKGKGGTSVPSQWPVTQCYHLPHRSGRGAMYMCLWIGLRTRAWCSQAAYQQAQEGDCRDGRSQADSPGRHQEHKVGQTISLTLQWFFDSDIVKPQSSPNPNPNWDWGWQ